MLCRHVICYAEVWPEIWGLPTLYLPNRFDGGVLRTSDGEYRLPINEERFGNHLHGFLQWQPAFFIKVNSFDRGNLQTDIFLSPAIHKGRVDGGVRRGGYGHHFIGMICQQKRMAQSFF